jgi:hypothetical protein
MRRTSRENAGTNAPERGTENSFAQTILRILYRTWVSVEPPTE